MAKLTRDQARPIKKAAQAALQMMEDQRERTGSPAAMGFATLEADGETKGLVLVCMEPTAIPALIQYVHQLGNFRTKVAIPEAN